MTKLSATWGCWPSAVFAALHISSRAIGRHLLALSPDPISSDERATWPILSCATTFFFTRWAYPKPPYKRPLRERRRSKPIEDEIIAFLLDACSRAAALPAPHRRRRTNSKNLENAMSISANLLRAFVLCLRSLWRHANCIHRVLCP